MKIIKVQTGTLVVFNNMKFRVAKNIIRINNLII